MLSETIEKGNNGKPKRYSPIMGGTGLKGLYRGYMGVIGVILELGLRVSHKLAQPTNMEPPKGHH